MSEKVKVIRWGQDNLKLSLLAPFIKEWKDNSLRYVRFVYCICYVFIPSDHIIIFFITLDYDKTINDTEGTVSSPRYYGKYPNNVDHYVTIMNREGSRIVLQFLLFDVHSTDFLEVRHVKSIWLFSLYNFIVLFRDILIFIINF